MKSIDSIETYAHGTCKYLVSDKGEIKCSNIIRQYQQRLILMMLQKKTQKNITKVAANS